MLSAEENTAELVEPPTKEEVDRAITSNLSNLLVVVSSSLLYSIPILKDNPDESRQTFQGLAILSTT